MDLGFKISLIGHGLLIGVALVSWPLSDRIAPPEVVSVTLVSDAPDVLDTPEPEVEEPPAPAPPPAPPERPTPPEPQPDETPIVPEATTSTAAPPPAPRISDTVSVEPEVTPEIDTAAPSIEVTPEPETVPEPIQEQEAATPPPSTTEIVTEAEKEEISDAATKRLPMLRPADLTILPKETPAPPVPQTPVDPDVASVLQEALAEPVVTAPARPLSGAERDGFRLAVQGCWVVDVGSQAANITVTVGFSLTQEGKVESNSVRLIAAEGEPQSAVETAFQTARRAVLRCQKGGYALPKDKYETWRDVEMTFNPKDMRIR